MISLKYTMDGFSVPCLKYFICRCQLVEVKKNTLLASIALKKNIKLFTRLMKPAWSGPTFLLRQISYQFTSTSVTSIVLAIFHYSYILECVYTLLILCVFLQAILSYGNILYLHSFSIWLTFTHPLLFKIIINVYKNPKNSNADSYVLPSKLIRG